MEFNYRFSHDASSIFSRIEGDDDYALNPTFVSLDKNNVYTKSLIVDIDKDIVEIPLIARTHCEDAIKSKLRSTEVCPADKLIVPLYVHSVTQNRRTFDSIFHQMNNTSYNNKLQKFVTNKGDVYYGGVGILFNENMEPLMMCTVAVRYGKDIINETEEHTFTYFRPIYHISPRVFGDNSNKMVEKNIIKKLIPYYSSRDIFFPSSSGSALSKSESNICKIVIDDFDDFFISPVKPKPGVCSNEVLNQCLVDNIEDVILGIKL